MTQKLAIYSLGGLRIERAGAPIPALASRKAEALLVYLAYTRRAHAREPLAAMFWSDYPQKRALGNLSVLVSSLRKHLAPYVTITRQTLAINPESGCWLDAAELEAGLWMAAVPSGAEGRLSPAAAAQLEYALALYQGDFLAGFYLLKSQGFEEWAILTRERLRRQAVAAMGELTAFHLRRREYPSGIEQAARLLEIAPLQEEAHRQQMQLLSRSGQRSAALAQYEACRRILAAELGVEPTQETTALYERIRASERIGAHNLPPELTAFVGREEQLAGITDRLDDPACRLLTLTGAGGAGKTRLALRFAHLAVEERADAFPHGIIFVPLAPLDTPDLLVPAVAEALGFSFFGRESPKTELVNYLQERRMLLALDNFERLLSGADGVELVVEILRRAPGVKLLVTSRQPLNLRAEWLLEIGGMAYPGDEAAAEPYGAALLFEQIARRAQPRFSFAAERSHVLRICQLVWGLPLGIELAASWGRTYTCREIAEELETGLDFLSTSNADVPERHRSMRAVFDHSWRLLSPEEGAVFRQLSVFRGGFERRAARQVVGASRRILAALVDKSLLQVTVGCGQENISSGVSGGSSKAAGLSRDARRYQLHEMLRQYAAEKLRAAPDHEALRERHSVYYAAFLQAQETRLQGDDQHQALTDIAWEIENARHAWHNALAQGSARQIEKSAESLYQFFKTRSRFQEGIALFAGAVAQLSPAGPQAGAYARALSRQGTLEQYLARYRAAAVSLERSLAIFERLEEQKEQIFCLVMLANVARREGKYAESAQLAQKSLSLSEETGDPWGVVTSRFLLGNASYCAGDIDGAVIHLETSLAAGRESGNPRLLWSPLNSLGDIACHRGEYTRAQSLFQQCLNLSRSLGDSFRESVQLNNLGTIFYVLGKGEEAQALYQQSLEICRELGDLEGQTHALNNLGEAANLLGEYPGAMTYLEECLSIARSIRNAWMTTQCLINLGETACASGDYPGARAHCIEALELARKANIRPLVMHALVNLAGIYAQTGKPGRAATLLALAAAHPACEQHVREKASRLLGEMEAAAAGDPAKTLEEVVDDLFGSRQELEASELLKMDALGRDGAASGDGDRCAGL